jgi:diguanylate cyclase (GGDEF)-like protein/PAS domain S-box-containing protein
MSAAGNVGFWTMTANKDVAADLATGFSIDDVDELRRVLDAVPHPIFIKDDQHRFVVANEAMCEFMGQAHERLVGMTDHAFVPKQHADVFRRIDRLVLDTGQDHENEELIPGGEAAMRTIVTRKKRVCLANGARLIIGSIADITELKSREKSQRLLFDNNPVPMWIYEISSLRFLAVNDAAIRHYGYSREQFLSMTLLDVRPPEDAEALKAAAGGSFVRYRTERTWRHIKADGTPIDVLIYAEALHYDGRDAGLVAIVDLTERQRAAEELRRTREFLDTVIENVPSIVFVKEAREHRYVLVNKAAENMLGIPREQVIGRTDFDLFPPDEASRSFNREGEVLNGEGLQLIEDETIHTPHKGARDLTTTRLAVDTEDGKSKYLLGVAEDVTERKRAAERIAHLANHDALTDLPNRQAFRERLDFTLERAALSSQGFAVLCLDLDRFKDVNDVFGHSAGDALLCEMARRFASVTDGAFLARVGGDEFTLVSAEGPQPATAVALADRLLETVAEGIEVDGHALRVGMSIGIAFYPGDGETANALLSNADAALYRAKADGRGVLRVFESSMDQELRERRSLQQDLRSALDNGELSLHYQPEARVSGEIVGFEALARWHHARRGMVSPAIFVPLAEESGLIIQIGEWVLRRACAEAASWPKPLQIAVNLSPVQFRHGDLPSLVHQVLIETGLKPARLELEITEGVLFDDLARATTILRRLKALGVKIAMDDFGTGYSSLSYLQSFPFDKIKIDRSFTSMVNKNVQSAAIIRAIVGLGRGLSVNIVAEGVETSEQLDFLRREDCNEVQGYFVGKPKPIEAYAAEVGRPAMARKARNASRAARARR